LLVIVVVTIGARWAFLRFYRAAYPIRYSELVVEESKRNALPPSLVYAVIRTESGFNPDAVSSVEARGLMQITGETLAWALYRENDPPLEEEALHDTAVNIRYGAVILRLHLGEFGSVENALCAYHAGRSNLLKWLNSSESSLDGSTLYRIPFADTAYYVNRVLDTQRIYQRLYHLELLVNLKEASKWAARRKKS